MTKTGILIAAAAVTMLSGEVGAQPLPNNRGAIEEAAKTLFGMKDLKLGVWTDLTKMEILGQGDALFRPVYGICLQAQTNLTSFMSAKLRPSATRFSEHEGENPEFGYCALPPISVNEIIALKAQYDFNTEVAGEYLKRMSDAPDQIAAKVTKEMSMELGAHKEKLTETVRSASVDVFCEMITKSSGVTAPENCPKR